jgi:RNA-directed DNA polymerase
MELRKRMHDPVAQTGAWVKQMLQGHLNCKSLDLI